MKTFTVKDFKHGLGRLNLRLADPVTVAKHGHHRSSWAAVKEFQPLKALEIASDTAKRL